MNLAYDQVSNDVNPRLTQHSKTMEQKVYQVGSNVYSAVGFGLEYPVMIVGDDGIIICDPAETIEMMESVLKAFRTITTLPIKAVVLTHSHGDHWGGISACVSDEQSASGEVKVIVDETFMAQFTQQSGELLDNRMGRAVFMYGTLLPVGPQGLVNEGCGPLLSKGAIKFVAPNTFVSKANGYETTICGVDFHFFHCEAETTDAICIFLPKEEIVIVGDAVQGEIFPNLYTIRGQFRDAKQWYRGIDKIRSYHPKAIVGMHMRPLIGQEEVEALLRDYRDAIQYTHDQAVRMLNKGHAPQVAQELLKQLPPHLYQRERIGEFYGTFLQGIRGVYDQYNGWFSGEASTLHPTPIKEAAIRHIDLMGGREKVLAAAQAAIDANDYQWAAELLNYPIRANHEDFEARKLKAHALRMLGYATENATWRNWYLTVAMGLEGTFDQIVKMYGENAGFPPASNSFAGLTPDAMFESIKVKLNGQLAQNVHLFVEAQIEGVDDVYTLEIRRGVLEVHKNRTFEDAVTITAPKGTWAKIVTREVLVSESDVTSSDALKADEFFGYFESFTSFVHMPFWME